MIDRVARNHLAQSARWLVGGRMTNWQFEDGAPTSSDPAVKEIFDKAFWMMYSDFPEYRLSGAARLCPELRNTAARSILFLKSGLPYEWPVLSRFAAARLVFLNLLTLGFAGRRYLARAASTGDLSLWPFRNAEQYASALQRPPYLGGL